MPLQGKGPKDLPAFLEAFYKVSDDPVDHDTYLSFFSEDATLVMGLKKFEGHEQIRQMRHAIWAAVATRHHIVGKVYPGGPPGELMLFGTVDYGLKIGKDLRSEWAARMVFDPKDAEKMKFYQVYLDASPGIIAQGKSIVPGENGEMEIR